MSLLTPYSTAWISILHQWVTLKSILFLIDTMSLVPGLRPYHGRSHAWIRMTPKREAMEKFGQVTDAVNVIGLSVVWEEHVSPSKSLESNETVTSIQRRRWQWSRMRLHRSLMSPCGCFAAELDETKRKKLEKETIQEDGDRCFRARPARALKGDK